MRPIVYPYKMGSATGKALAQAFEAKRVYPNGKYVPRSGDVIINFGNSVVPEWWVKFAATPGIMLLNYMVPIKNAADKREAFKIMSQEGVRVPPFTFEQQDAKAWLGEGKVVVERQKVTGHSADGLVLRTNPTEDLSKGKLFTQYVKKRWEYRVHIVMGAVADVTMKRLRNGIEEPDYKVRNHTGGWVFTRQGIEIPNDVLNQAIKAVEALHLDFGAVDIGWNQHAQEATVYEVNTAAGMADTTLYRVCRKIAQRTGLTLVMDDPGNYEHDMAINPMENGNVETPTPAEPNAPLVNPTV